MKRITFCLIAMLSFSSLYAITEGEKLFEVGMTFYEEEEYPKAYENFFRATNENHKDSFYYLAYCLENGLGAPQDYQRAALFYQKGAKLGDIKCFYRLAGLYRDGKGVEQDFYKANEYYTLVLEEFKSISGEYDDKVSGVYIEQAALYVEQEDYTTALDYYYRALRIENRLHGTNTDRDFLCTKRIAEIFYLQQEYEKAETTFLSALDKLEKLKNQTPEEKAFINDRLGRIYETEKEYEKALKSYETALIFYQLAVTLQDPLGKSSSSATSGSAGSKNTIGNAKDSAQSLSDSEENENDDDTVAIEDDPETESLESAGEYLNIARIYIRSETQDSIEKALYNAEKALTLTEKFSPEPCAQTAQAVSLLALIYDKMSYFKQSLESSKRSLAISRVINGPSHPETLYALYNIIILDWIQMQNYKEAASMLNTLFSLCQGSQGYGEVLDILWDLYINWQTVPKKFVKTFDPLKKRCFDSAMDTVQKIRNLSLPSSMKNELFEKCIPFYYAAVDYYSKQDNPAQAFYYAELLKLSGISETLSYENLMSTPGLSESEKQQIESYNRNIAQYSASIIKQNLKETKDRDTTSITTTSQKLLDTRRDLELLEKTIAKRVPVYISRKKIPVTGLSEARSLISKESSSKIALEYVIWEEKFKDVIEEKNAESLKMFSLREHARKFLEIEQLGKKPNDIKEQKNDTFIIETEPPHVELKSWCIVLTSGKTSCVSLESGFDYGSAVTNLRNLLIGRTDPSEAQLLNYRKSLYEKIILPVEPNIPDFTQDVLIVPDGSFSYLPFDILGDGELPDFGEKYSVSITPSISLSAKKKADALKGDFKVLAFGNPIYDRIKKGNNRGIISHTQTKAELPEGKRIKELAKESTAAEYFNANGISWKNIPGTGNELHKIQDKIFSGGVTLIEGINASEETLKSLSRNRSLLENSILHFACHTYIDNTYPLMTSLVLSDSSDASLVKTEDGYLTLTEISRLNMNATLAMISACQTDITELTNGKSVTSLAESFLLAGAKNVGIALWNVDDEATCIFFERLYQKLQSKAFRTGEMTLSQIYRSAKEDLKLEKDWINPYYWSSFVLFE